MNRDKIRKGVRYGVYRCGRGLSKSFLGALEGRWDLLENVPDHVDDAPVEFSGRYEFRDDDTERAAVFLVWPPT